MKLGFLSAILDGWTYEEILGNFILFLLHEQVRTYQTENIYRQMEELEIPEEPDEKSKEKSSRIQKNTWKQPSKKLRFTYKEQKEFETIDDEITGLEEEIEQMDQKITENVTNSARLNELVKSKEELEAKLDEKMESHPGKHPKDKDRSCSRGWHASWGKSWPQKKESRKSPQSARCR